MEEGSDRVKRPYVSPLRTQQVGATRRAVVEAAGRLFASQGYAATSIEAIAAEAGVSRATVFSAAGGKSELLRLARDAALGGDDEDVPVAERAWFKEAMAQTDPRALLALQARNYRRIQERAARLEQALVAAAAADPRLTPLRTTAAQQRLRGAEIVASRLAEVAGTVLSCDVMRARDVIYALASPAVFVLLTDDLGWTGDAYEGWLATTLQAQLLGSDGP